MDTGSSVPRDTEGESHSCTAADWTVGTVNARHMAQKLLLPAAVQRALDTNADQPQKRKTYAAWFIIRFD